MGVKTMVAIIHLKNILNNMSKLKTRTANDLKRIREQKGLTAGELAGKIGISRNLLFRWESGENNLTLGTIERICRELEVDPKMIFLEK